MKKTSLLFLFLISINFSAQNFELSTLRIGDFTLKSTNKDVEKITNAKLKIFEDYNKTNLVKYAGEVVEITINKDYENQDKEAYNIYTLSTKSKKFRTKSGMGVGSTKEQLLDAYKNYPNFSVNQMWDEKTEKFSTTKSNFILTDNDAGTMLSFTLINNTVVEVSVFYNEGC
jgi:hypothetical protein